MAIVMILIWLLIIGIVGTLCLFIWASLNIKDELWDTIEEKEEKDERGRL